MQFTGNIVHLLPHLLEKAAPATIHKTLQVMTGGARIGLTKEAIWSAGYPISSVWSSVFSELVCLCLILLGGCSSLQTPSSVSLHPSVQPLLFPSEWKVEAAVRACRRYSQPCVTASLCFCRSLPSLHPPCSSLSAPNHQSAADAAWQITGPTPPPPLRLVTQTLCDLCRPQTEGVFLTPLL